MERSGEPAPQDEREWVDAYALEITARSLSRCIRYLEALGLGARGTGAAGGGRTILEEIGYDLEADRRAQNVQTLDGGPL